MTGSTRPEGIAGAQPGDPTEPGVTHPPPVAKRTMARALPSETSSVQNGQQREVVEAEEEAVRVGGLPWSIALQRLMRVSGPCTGRPEFAWGRDNGQISWESLGIYAERIERHVIYLAFPDLSFERSPRVMLAWRGKKGITVFEDCELWALNQRSKIEILTPSRRFKLDDEGRLTSKPNNLDEMRARRVALTGKRWTSLAAKLVAELAAKGITGGTAIPKELFKPKASADGTG